MEQIRGKLDFCRGIVPTTFREYFHKGPYSNPPLAIRLLLNKASSVSGGLPHERQFTVACMLLNHREVGRGKSKKVAKRQAAHRMLLLLQDTPLPMGEGAPDDEVRSFNITNITYKSVSFSHRITILSKNYETIPTENTK